VVLLVEPFASLFSEDGMVDEVAGGLDASATIMVDGMAISTTMDMTMRFGTSNDDFMFFYG
jgi:hypothetical protein